MREKKFVCNLDNAKVIYSGIKNAGIDMVVCRKPGSEKSSS